MKIFTHQVQSIYFRTFKNALNFECRLEKKTYFVFNICQKWKHIQKKNQINIKYVIITLYKY